MTINQMIRFEQEAQEHAVILQHSPGAGRGEFRVRVLRHAITFRMRVRGLAIYMPGGTFVTISAGPDAELYCLHDSADFNRIWARVQGDCPACSVQEQDGEGAFMGCLLTGQWRCNACGCEGDATALEAYPQVMPRALAGDPILHPPFVPFDMDDVWTFMQAIKENFPLGVYLYIRILLSQWPRYRLPRRAEG